MKLSGVTIMEKENALKSVFENLKLSWKGLLSLGLVLIGIHLISLLLGFAIFFIVFGVQIAMTRVVIYWTPTRNWLVKTFGLKINEYDVSKVTPSYKLLINIFHSAIALFFIVLGFYVIKLGVDILLQDGFLGQNFIYLIFFR
jgi:hypothetical protein